MSRFKKAAGFKAAAHAARNLEDQNEEEGGLSGGAIAGIVSAVVLVVLFILLWRYKRPYIMQIWTTAENIDQIEPRPEPPKWTCLGEPSKLDIQSNPDIKSKEVYNGYNGKMLFYKDYQGNLRQFETSGLTRPKKRLSKRLSKQLSKRLSWWSKNGANNDETYTTIIKKIPEGEGELFPEGEGELTLPNSGLQSSPKDETSLEPGEWCLARLEQPE